MKIKKIIALGLIVLTAWGGTEAQVRDRRADLKVQCGSNAGISTSGRLWMVDKCGHVWTADSIGTSWRKMLGSEDEYITNYTFEHIAAFGNAVAVVAGYLSAKGNVLRTTTEGHLWDTVRVDKNLVWVHGFSSLADGHLWLASASGRTFKNMAYSTDSGRTFTPLMPPFVDPKDGEGGIETLYMTSADSGFAGTYRGDIYSTSDNWHTAHRMASPTGEDWIIRLRPWQGWLLATKGYLTYGTRLDGTPQWNDLHLITYEVDTTTGCLWAIDEDGRLLLKPDMEHERAIAEVGNTARIIGTLGGRAYLMTPDGIVRIGPDGGADTCGFYTEEKTLEQAFEEQLARYGENVPEEYIFTPLEHGGRLWRTDFTSIYLHDALGWYRVAKPLEIEDMKPDPDHEDRVVLLRNDSRNYSVDTAGRMEPYTYASPLANFVDQGLQHMTITTGQQGCFHYSTDSIVFVRQGDILRETGNNVEQSQHTARSIPASIVERALMDMGETYSLAPTPEEFGLRKGDVDFGEVFNPRGGCTSSSFYELTMVNGAGDTLRVYGSSDHNCGTRFPWLLPMEFDWREATFVSYHPQLWQLLRHLMPTGMMLRPQLQNAAMVRLRPGDLLFYRGEGGMNDAVRESTGEYTHVAIVESVGDSWIHDTTWIIDATQRHGVSRRPLLRTPYDEAKPFPDIYRLTVGFDTAATLARARALVGLPYDNAFLPDNGAYYCSELVQQCYLGADGTSLFPSAPMNWRDAKGKMPRYWKRHFKKLKMAVPEGVPGTNPTTMSRSPLLRKL